jgi:hypothetical protein
MLSRPFCVVAMSIAVLGLAGCAEQSAAPSGAWAPGLSPAGSHAQWLLAPDTKFSVSGTYEGSVKWTDQGHSYSGSLKLTLAQDGSKLSGSFEITRNDKTVDLSLSGTVKIEGKKKAGLAFIIHDPRGKNADATATVTGKRLTGKATAGATDISFSAKKTKHA